MKYICMDCGEVFSEPMECFETHGLSAPPYEELSLCPYCGGDYTQAHKCDACGEYIDGQYIKLWNGERFCEECYTIYELGEEY